MIKKYKVILLSACVFNLHSALDNINVEKVAYTAEGYKTPEDQIIGRQSDTFVSDMNAFVLDRREEGNKVVSTTDATQQRRLVFDDGADLALGNRSSQAESMNSMPKAPMGYELRFSLFPVVEFTLDTDDSQGKLHNLEDEIQSSNELRIREWIDLLPSSPADDFSPSPVDVLRRNSRSEGEGGMTISSLLEGFENSKIFSA